MGDHNNEARENFLEACSNGDLLTAQRLFAESSLTAEDASRALEDVAKEEDLKSRLDLYRFLLEQGADVNVVTYSPVPSLDILKLLTEFGLDIKADGHTILQDYSDDRQTVDWLLDQGVDINQTDTSRRADGRPGYSFMFDWSNHLLNNVAANGDIGFFDHLVSRGADPQRSLALHEVSRCRNDDKATAMVHHLLDTHNMDIHADNEDLRDFFHEAPDSGTPLCSALDNRNLAVVKALLQKGARIDKWGEHGHHPVSIAAGLCLSGRRFPPAIRPLLEAGAEPTSALKCVVRSGMVDAAEVCLEHGADPIIGLEKACEQDAANPAHLRNWKNSEPGDVRGREQIEREITQRMQEMVKLMEKWCEKLKDTPADPGI